MSAPRPSIDLSIDELVLHGFAPEQRRSIGAALERELTRLLGERSSAGALTALTALGNAPHIAHVAHIDAGAFSIAAGGSPEAIGASVARAVYGGLTQGGPAPRSAAPSRPSPPRGAR